MTLKPTIINGQWAYLQPPRQDLEWLAKHAQQPPYPSGNVIAACVCGSWPGGDCLRCEWRLTK